MPVRRRTAKRRLSPEGELNIWGSVFDGGYDFFSELPEIGVPADEYGRPDEDVARDAWERLGAMHLAAGGNADWAIEQFGEPQCL